MSWRVLVVETGEYLYRNSGQCRLFTKYETSIYPTVKFKIFKAKTKNQAIAYIKHTLNSSFLRLDANITIKQPELDNSFEIVKV